MNNYGIIIVDILGENCKRGLMRMMLSNIIEQNRTEQNRTEQNRTEQANIMPFLSGYSSCSNIAF